MQAREGCAAKGAKWGGESPGASVPLSPAQTCLPHAGRPHEAQDGTGGVREAVGQLPHSKELQNALLNLRHNANTSTAARQSTTLTGAATRQ